MNDVAAERAAPLLATDVSARRGGRIIVAGFSIRIEAGQVFVLRGPNGAGKTTLLRTLAGYSPCASGTLARQSASTAFLGHADGVKTALTARENLEFWKKLYGSTDDAVARSVAALAIAPFVGQQAATLSAGQRRRLALGRIVISQRPIWLLDEPTAGMDAQSVDMVVDLIHQHARTGGSAVVATHELLPFEKASIITLSEAA